MSLRLLLPEPGVTALLTSWPDKSCVYEREAGELDRVINPETIDHCLETGCVPADEIAVVSSGAALHPDRHRTAGRTDPVKLRSLYEDGHRFRLYNLQRVVPFLADVSRGSSRRPATATACTPSSPHPAVRVAGHRRVSRHDLRLPRATSHAALTSCSSAPFSRSSGEAGTLFARPLVL